MIEFMRGIRTPVNTVLDAGGCQDLVEERRELRVPVPDHIFDGGPGVLQVHHQVSCRLAHSLRGGVRRGAEDPDAPGGVLDDREDVLAPAGQGDGLDEVACQGGGVGLGAQEVGPGGGGSGGRGVDALVLEDLPDGIGGDLDAEGGELAVHSAVAPRRVLPDQAQDQDADRANGGRAARPLRSAGADVALLDRVAVPSQHGVGLGQQPEPTQNLARQRHRQSGEEGSVFRGELHPVRPDLSFEDHDLVAQGENLRVLVAVAHR